MIKFKIKLAVVISVFVVAISCKNNTYKSEENYFKFNDSSKVTEITIIDTLNTIHLLKTSSGWKINGYHASKNYIDYLFKITSQLEIHSKISKEKSADINNILKKKSIKVNFIKNRRILKTLQVSTLSEEETSFYGIKEENEIYKLYIPGYQYAIYPIFSTSLSHWRNKLFIDFSPIEIKEINFIDGQESTNSYKIINHGKRKYEIYNYKNKPIKFDRNKLERYLSYFRNINFYRQIENNVKEIKDSLAKENFKYQIKIASKTDTCELKIYPIISDYSTNIIGKTMAYNPNKFYFTTPKDSMVYIGKYIDFEPIIKKLKYFTLN